MGSEPRQLEPAALLPRNELLQICVQLKSPPILLDLKGTLINGFQIPPHVNAGRIILSFSLDCLININGIILGNCFGMD